MGIDRRNNQRRLDLIVFYKLMDVIEGFRTQALCHFIRVLLDGVAYCDYLDPLSDV